MARKKPIRFPKRELNDFVRKHKAGWTHEEWEQLLAKLKEQGFGEHLDTPDKVAQIGQYIEDKRDSAAK